MPLYIGIYCFVGLMRLCSGSLLMCSVKSGQLTTLFIGWHLFGWYFYVPVDSSCGVRWIDVSLDSSCSLVESAKQDRLEKARLSTVWIESYRILLIFWHLNWANKILSNWITVLPDSSRTVVATLATGMIPLLGVRTFSRQEPVHPGKQVLVRSWLRRIYLFTYPWISYLSWNLNEAKNLVKLNYSATRQ